MKANPQHPARSSLAQLAALNRADQLPAAEAILRHAMPHSVDLVIADVPYGQRSGWHGAAAIPSVGSSPTPSPVWRLLEALRPIVAPHGIVAIAANKEQRVRHERYRTLEHLRLGKRHTVLLTPME